MTADVFFKELQRLVLAQPKRPTQILNSENCELGNYIYYCKNMSYCFDCTKSTDGTYLFDSHNNSNCADCDFTFESELCYESVDAFKCFNCEYLEDCSNMTDSSYSHACTGCHDVFGCTNLSNKSFCIFNRQLTETEYREKVKYLKTLPPEKILKVLEDIKMMQPVTQTHESNNENSPYGNYISFNKNCYYCFDASHNENGGYIYDSSRNKYCYEVLQSGDLDLSYEVIDSGKIFNSNYIVFSKDCLDSSYLFDCLDVKNSIGCVMLGHKQYCILNRQYTKEEYEKLSKPLLAELAQKNLGWNSLAY